MRSHVNRRLLGEQDACFKCLVSSGSNGSMHPSPSTCQKEQTFQAAWQCQMSLPWRWTTEWCLWFHSWPTSASDCPFLSLDALSWEGCYDPENMLTLNGNLCLCNTLIFRGCLHCWSFQIFTSDSLYAVHTLASVTTATSASSSLCFSCHPGKFLLPAQTSYSLVKPTLACALAIVSANVTKMKPPKFTSLLKYI